MHYTSVFTFCLAFVVILSFSNANPAWHTIQPLENDKVTNYGNSVLGSGINSNNVIIMDRNDVTPTAAQPQPTRAHKVTSISNIGNGIRNRNVVINNIGGQGQVISQDIDPKGINTDGTSFIRTRYNGEDIINMGYGFGNQNKVIIHGKPLETESTSTYKPIESDIDPIGINTDGTSFIRTRNNGEDIINMGYGFGNQNKVIIHDKPLESDNTDNYKPIESGSTGTDKPVESDNTGEQQPASFEFENQLRKLYNMAEQLQQIVFQLVQVLHTNITKKQ